MVGVKLLTPKGDFMKKTRNIILTLIFTLSAAASSMPVMAKPDDPGLDIEKICKPYLAPPGQLQPPIPYPYNLICWPR